MTTNKIRKVGSSLVVSIPPIILELCNIKENDEVVFRLNGKHGIVIQKL